ncbi:MAG TPA: ABC transporter ATP-binding protein [Bryobacteraceae bacterium]|jgi:ATP-binding cassette subfamily B protein|nr:ABC transporter ATP-binding protein [Bryobacteraceae bacterium]
MSSKSDTRKAILNVFAFLFRHWKRRRATVLLIAASMTLATVADLLMPVYSGRLVDAIAASKASRIDSLHSAETAVACMAGLGLLLICARYIAFMAITRLTVHLMSDIASEAFWRLQRLSTDWQANNFAGSIVRRITRGMWAVDLMDDTLLLALLPAFVVLAGSALVLGMHWLSVGFLVVIAATCYIMASIMLSVGYVAPAARLSNAQDTRVGAALADSVTCNPVVKSFGAEAREEARLHRVLKRWARRTYRHWMLATRSSGTQLTVLLAFRTLITSYAVVLWWRGLATPGDMVFILTSYFIVHGYLRDVGQHVANLQRSVNEMEEMVSLQSETLGIIDRPNAQPLRVSEGSIVFDRVCFRYAQALKPLFTDLSLHISPGERVGLVGHSGSGKTTFVKLLHRLYDVTGGRILIDGQDISLVRQQSLRAQLALVPQEPILFHRSLAENIAYGRPEATRGEIEEAACLANAHEFISSQPKGYATLVGERGIKLSGGERQRVALARAFLANAPILILDEATSSLDSESEATIQEAMERLMVGRTSIVIAHRLSTVRMLDRILVFDRGRIIEEGSHDSLVRKLGGTYQRLFEKQAMGLISDSA